MVKLNEYVPIADDRRLVVLPNIPEGEYAQSWADVYNREVQERFEGNANLIPSDDFSGMNFFKALLVDEIAKREYKGAVRVSLPRDLDSKVVAMVKDRFYTIPRALAFRDTSEIWERNKPIADELAGHIEHAHGRMPKYAMIQGLVVNPWPDNTQGYQLMVVPVEREFRVIEDDRLSPEFNGLYFSQIDKDGLPVDLTEEQGDKTQRWFTSNQRLSWFYLYGDSVLNAGNFDLAGSVRCGRVVLSRGEATSAEILRANSDELERIERENVAQVKERSRKARNYLLTGKLE